MPKPQALRPPKSRAKGPRSRAKSWWLPTRITGRPSTLGSGTPSKPNLAKRANLLVFSPVLGTNRYITRTVLGDVKGALRSFQANVDCRRPAPRLAAFACCWQHPSCKTLETRAQRWARCSLSPALRPPGWGIRSRPRSSGSWASSGYEHMK